MKTRWLVSIPVVVAVVVLAEWAGAVPREGSADRVYEPAVRQDPTSGVLFLSKGARDTRLKYGRHGRHFYLFLDENGLPLHAGLPLDLTHNDFVHVYLEGPLTVLKTLRVEISGAFEGDDFAIQGLSAEGKVIEIEDGKSLKGTAERVKGLLQETGVPVALNLGAYGPFAAPSITIDVYKIDGKERQSLRSFKIRVAQTYLASLGVGFGQSRIRFHRFEVSIPRDSTQARIRDASESKGELRPLLVVNFNAWRFWEKGWWLGRDPNQAPDLLDRLRPFVGVGLRKPGEEYVVGASMTLARGLELSGGCHFAKVEILDQGFRENDLFGGTGEEIPRRDDWATEIVFALSLDARLAAKVLAGVFN